MGDSAHTAAAGAVHCLTRAGRSIAIWGGHGSTLLAAHASAEPWAVLHTWHSERLKLSQRMNSAETLKALQPQK